MEKIRALIAKIQELEQSNATLSTLSYYTQLLYAEIMRVKSETRNHEIRTKINVSVILPADLPEQTLIESIDPNPEITVSSNGRMEEFGELAHHNGYKKVINHEFSYPPMENQENILKTISSGQANAWVRTSGVPIKEKVEVNEMGQSYQPSINERLRQEQQEIAEKLSTAKVRDLQEAIMLNDKFLFINELFRGDRDMYERSIRTINGFSSVREAEYWIERELKIKMGWHEENDMVKSFYCIVRKRFP
jgi:hypothetical protein